jgi:phosphohistidine phosphatase SixA
MARGYHLAMRRLFFPLLTVLVLLQLPTLAGAQTAEPTLQQALQTDGAILLLRHANAPGVGDPPAFRLGDCTTQRNLDEEGRAQARRIGEQLRALGARVTAVWSSQWCRTEETARLAFPGLAVRGEPAFNSFFGAQHQADQQRQTALSRIASWRGPGVLAVVTHQVNITGLTDVNPASGEGVVARMQAGRLVAIARAPAP